MVTIAGLEIEETTQDGVPVLAVGGELDLATAPDLCRCLEAHRGEPFVVDLSQISFCDSSGLRALLGETHECRIAGGRTIVLVPAEGQVRHLFDMTGMSSMLEIADDLGAAVGRLAIAR
jgi:anti-anti-sigma factor